MIIRYFTNIAFLALTVPVLAQQAEPPQGQASVLRVEAQGPTAYVTSIALSSDGKTLYAGGYDKVVRVWKLREGQFQLADRTFRVPIGPDLGGTINAIALSGDDNQLAVAGSFPFRGGPRFNEPGLVVERIGGMTRENRLEQGTIYLFDINTGAVRALQGHEGTVHSLAFAPGDRAVLVSAGREWDDGKKTYSGVARMWDVGKRNAPLIATLPDLPDLLYEEVNWISRPGLAVWHQDDKPQVAIAWEDGRTRDFNLRLWNGNRVNQNRDSYYNATVAHLPQQSRLLTTSIQGTGGGMSEYEGRLREWLLTPKGPVPTQRPVARLGRFRVPRALALLSSRANGQADYAAVALRAPQEQEEYSLQLVDLTTFTPVFDSPITLWKAGAVFEPTLSASLRGQHLVVAGNPNNSIAVFSIKELLEQKGKAKPAELHSAGSALSYVAFVKKDKGHGLVFSDTLVKKPGKHAGLAERGPFLLFDITNRTLVENADGWQADRHPGAAEWEVEADPQHRIFQVKKDGEDAGRITLRKGQNASGCDYAVLPPGPQFKIALLAVAFVENGETKLCIYRVDSGELVRELTGHAGRVRALAFSGDGRLLASASEDQTLAVWSLTSLGNVLDQHGRLLGIAVEKNQDGKGVVVAHIDNDQLTEENRNVMKKGDVIEGVMAGDRLNPLASAEEFYRAMWVIPRQQTATLQVNGRQVKLELSQGVDQQQALFSFFVTREGALKDRQEWVGWSPGGYYDASGREAEAFLGYHKNTGAPRFPVEFARAADFRKDHYRADILRYLVEKGASGEAFEAWDKDNQPKPPPEPNRKLGFKEGGLPVPTDAQGRYLVTRRQATVSLGLLNQFPDSLIASAEWKSEDNRGNLQFQGQSEWSADLSSFPWKRGEHAFTVTLKTREAQPREFSSRATVAFQPLPPELIVEAAPSLVSREQQQRLKFLVVPRGHLARVKVSQGHEKEETVLFETKDVDATLEKELAVTLKPGENTLHIEAFNQDAPRETVAGERRDWSRRITFQVPKPQLHLEKIVFLDRDGIEQALPIDQDNPDAPLVIEVPRFRLEGDAGSILPLERAEWVTAGEKPVSLTGFDAAAKPKTLTINQEIALPKAMPGKHLVRVLVSAGKEQMERSFTVEYRPLLPVVDVITPADQQPLYWPATALRVPLTASLTWPRDAHPAKLQVLVNGKQQGEVHEVDGGMNTFTGEVLLQNGDNRIELHVTNDWRSRPAIAKVDVPYRRPPDILKVKTGKTFDKPPRCEVTVRVRTPADLPLTRAEIRTWKDSERTATRQDTRIYLVSPDKMKKGDDPETWIIEVDDVPLEEGKNAISVEVWNEDGRSLKPGEGEATYKTPPPPRAAIDFLTPTGDLTVVSTPKYRVRLRFESKSEMTRVALVRGDEVLYSAEGARLAEKQRKEGTLHVVEVEHDVSLERGKNLLNGTATNAGGENISPAKTIEYDYKPMVRLHIERMEAGGQVHLPDVAVSTEGGLRFPEAPESRVFLSGQVSWSPDSDEAARSLSHLKVFVNGRPRLPVLFDPPPAGRVRTFRTQLLLTEKDNHIEFQLPSTNLSMVLDEGSQAACAIPCAQPGPPPQGKAHLLVLSINSTDKEEVTKNALKAIGARNQRGNDFQLDYCSQGGHLYDTLVGHRVTPDLINKKLFAIGQHLALRARAGATDDVVMIYYAGEHLTRKGRHFLKHGAGLTPISCDMLADLFSKTPGVHLLWLDVKRDLDDRGVALNDPLLVTNLVHLAVFRYTQDAEQPLTQSPGPLLTKLGEAIPQVKNLAQLREHLAQDFNQPASEKFPWPSKQFKNRLLYDEHMVPELKQVRVGLLK